jgi:hypothetical protein
MKLAASEVHRCDQAYAEVNKRLDEMVNALREDMANRTHEQGDSVGWAASATQYWHHILQYGFSGTVLEVYEAAIYRLARNGMPQ